MKKSILLIAILFCVLSYGQAGTSTRLKTTNSASTTVIDDTNLGTGQSTVQGVIEAVNSKVDSEAITSSLLNNQLTLTLNNGNSEIIDLSDISTSSFIYDNQGNTNPELLIDWGSTSMPPNEQYDVVIFEGYEPTGNATATAKYDTSNGIGTVVTEVEGDGTTSNPIFRIKFETEDNRSYDFDFRYRTISSNTGGRIAILGGSAIVNQQIPNNANEWTTIRFTAQDTNSSFDGIVFGIQGYQGTSKFQFKASQKLSQ